MRKARPLSHLFKFNEGDLRKQSAGLVINPNLMGLLWNFAMHYI